MPTSDQMADLLRDPEQFNQWTHARLRMLRDQTADPAAQAVIAPYEHQAFTRELTAERPWMAPGLLAAAPGYYVAKKAGLMQGRTEPTFDQVLAGWKGTGEGLVRALREAAEKVAP